MPKKPLAIWAWAGCLAVGGIAAILTAFGIMTTALSWGIVPGSIDGGPRIDLALLLVLIGVLGSAVVVASVRLVYAYWPPVAWRQAAVPAIGIAVAVAVELALHEWARVHIGQYEFDYMGITAILSLTVILLAISWFAALVAPPAAAGPPMVGVVAGVAIISLIALSNVPGLRDGIEAESWPLAILIGLSVLYAVVGVANLAWRGRRH